MILLLLAWVLVPPSCTGVETANVGAGSARAILCSSESGMEDEDEDARALGRQISAEVRKGIEEEVGIHEQCSRKWVDLIEEAGDHARFAARIIGEDRCVSLTDALVKLTHHSNPSVRGMVAQTLGLLGSQTALPALRQLLRDEDDQTQAVSFRAVCRLSPAECKSMLRGKALEAPSWRVRMAAVQIASKLHYEFSAQDVRRLLEDPVAEVGWAALLELRCEYLANGELLNSVLGLASEVGEDTSGRRFLAIESLGRCNIKEAGPLLTRMLANRDHYHIEGQETWGLIRAIAACGGHDGVSAIEKFASSHTSPEELRSIGASNIYTGLEAAYDVLAEIGG